MLSNDRDLVENIRRALNTELIKRSLTRYFVEDKGFDNFNRPIYAPMLQDVAVRVPELVSKVEIVPYVKDLNPATGQVVVGWNMFVLGTHRMSLGDSSHNNMSEFQRSIYGPTPSSVATMQKSPSEIIEFVTKVMAANKSGVIQPTSQVSMPISPRSGRIGPSISGGYYERSKVNY
jgi:hypothetical protein